MSNKTIESLKVDDIELVDFEDVIEKYSTKYGQFDITISLCERNSSYLMCATEDKVLIAYRLYETKNNGTSLYMKREYFNLLSLQDKVEPLFTAIGNQMAKDMRFGKQKVHISNDDLNYEIYCELYLRRGYTITKHNVKKCTVLTKQVSNKTLDTLM